MATVLPPVRNDVSGTAPNPSNAVARTAFGVLHDYLMNLLGSAGTPAAACTTLGAYQKSSILGTVSQSAGVPTGAIIETGTNANGRYIKYADGRLSCTQTVLANATLTPGQFVGTVAFAATPVGDYVVTGTCYLYAAINQGGNNLYSVPMSYTPNTIVFMNTGTSPQVSAPSFTLGATNALSYKLTQQLEGRWY